MSGYILCQTKKADTPYFVENISTNIYTLEEIKEGMETYTAPPTDYPGAEEEPE